MSELLNLGIVDELKKQPIHCIEDHYQFVLIYQQGEFFLLDNLCPHKAAALCDGDLKGFEIQCPWHRAKFDIRTGRGLSPLAGAGVKSWPLTIEEGCLMADLSAAD
ncbi:MAG: Rieske 2Fe-2S domain-containing protein [Gammaproteobacteria bacterium]|nr:Rieske 2Fe-2S domain-containing protein [Gammaproteobacteria bacterium]